MDIRPSLRCATLPSVPVGESIRQKVRIVVMVRFMLRAGWVADAPGRVSGVFRPCRDAVKRRGAGWK